jgi:hypothetical protein
MTDKHIRIRPEIQSELIVYPISCYIYLSKRKVQHYESSDKVIIPNRFLKIIERNLSFNNGIHKDEIQSESGNQIFLRFTNKKNKNEVYTSIGEFCEDDKFVYMPNWLMDTLDIKSGERINIDSVSLPKVEYVKFTIPQEFKDANINSIPVLEYCLKHHTTLYITKMLNIHMFEKIYTISVAEIKPDYACTILNSDVKYDIVY